jgi:integrase
MDRKVADRALCVNLPPGGAACKSRHDYRETKVSHMPRPRDRFPSYRLHRSSGQAVVTLDGHDLYLGQHNTQKSRDAYERAVLEWKMGRKPLGQRIAAVDVQSAATSELSVLSMVAAYWRHIERQGKYMKNGEPTMERRLFVHALRPLARLYGSVAASQFGPRDLQVVREALAKPHEWTHKETTRPRKRKKTMLSRKTVNGHVKRICKAFRVAASLDLIPIETYQRLLTVEALRRGEVNYVAERQPVRPVDERDFNATLSHLSADIAAMVKLQWYTGARPGEILGLRTIDVDRTGPQWCCRPESHKTEHHGKTREIWLGHQAMDALRPFLKADPKLLIFDMGLSARTAGKVRLDHYRDAVLAGCKAAGIGEWTPNRLRHSWATRVRKTRHGLEGARAGLGHSSLSTTEIYAERDSDLAREVAAEVG